MGNETPEPNVIKEFPVTADEEREEGQSEIKEVSSDAGEETVCGDSKGSKILTVPPTIFKRTAEELVRRLESVYGGVPLTFLHKSLVDSLIEEVELVDQIKVTDQVLNGRLFPDENEAIRHIVSEAVEQNVVLQAPMVPARVQTHGILVLEIHHPAEFHH